MKPRDFCDRSRTFATTRTFATKPVGVLNGAVSKAGKEVGIPTPANDFITTCLAVADRGARARRSLAASS